MVAYLIGIDEAGYGPLLGPLVVSASVLEMPEAHLAANHWDLLCAAVADSKKHLRGRLLIADSKKAYHRKDGIGGLQRTALAVLASIDELSPCPATAEEFLRAVCPECLKRLLEYPWYRQFAAHALETAPDHSVAVACLKNTLISRQMRFGGVYTRCADVRYLNQRFAVVKNKSRVLFTEVCGLIHTIYQKHASPAAPLQFLIDRQGGRADYSRELMRMFPQFELTVLKMDNRVSSYELAGSNGAMRVHFAVGADGKYLLVSLSSMISKFVRELCMHHLNTYFTSTYPDLEPTAGYWTDGQRFIRDLTARQKDFKIDPNILIRTK